MSKNLRLGAASIAFSQPLYIESAASIVSQKEADGPLGDLFDLVCEDPMFGCDTWESAESTLQKETATQAISKAGLSSEDIHLMFAGDLLAQTSATCFGSAGLGIPFYGLYGACSTIGEALSLGSLALTAGFGTRVLCATSSHFASAEKEFRLVLLYSYRSAAPDMPSILSPVFQSQGSQTTLSSLQNNCAGWRRAMTCRNVSDESGTCILMRNASCGRRMPFCRYTNISLSLFRKRSVYLSDKVSVSVPYSL